MTNETGPDWHYVDAPRSLGRVGRIIAWIVILGLLGGVVAFVLDTSDRWARDVATDAVRSAVVTALELDSARDVDIELGEGLLVFQAISGSVDEVTVTVPDFLFEGGSATLVLVVTGVPLDPSSPVESMRATVSFDAAQTNELRTRLSAVEVASATLVAGGVEVAAAIDAAGTLVPLQVRLAPVLAEGGVVVFTPDTVTLDGVAQPAAEFLAGPYGPFAAPVLTPRNLCVAELLPSALTVDGVEVTDSRLVFTARAADVSLRGGGFTTKGSCEPA